MEKYYTILGLNVNASKDEVKKAFHKLAHVHHPDKGGDAEVFKKIVNAYNELMKMFNTPIQQPQFIIYYYGTGGWWGGSTTTDGGF